MIFILKLLTYKLRGFHRQFIYMPGTYVSRFNYVRITFDQLDFLVLEGGSPTYHYATWGLYNIFPQTLAE